MLFVHTLETLAPLCVRACIRPSVLVCVTCIVTLMEQSLLKLCYCHKDYIIDLYVFDVFNMYFMYLTCISHTVNTLFHYRTHSGFSVASQSMLVSD